MHPIIALWSHPRSMSTAMERVMRERGDLDCAHEPFLYDYYVHRQVREFPMFDMQEDQPASYADNRDLLLKRAEAGPVFFKDMSFYAYDQVLADEEFSARLTNCFLIRNPVASILSYFKLDPDATLEEVGLEAQFHHYNALVTRGEAPVILDAGDVRQNTRAMMAAWWEIIGLPFREQAFDWQKPAPDEWEQVEGWHGDVSQASGIRPLTAQDAARQRADFEEMAKSHPRMLDCLEHHLPFYEALKAQALCPERRA